LTRDHKIALAITLLGMFWVAAVLAVVGLPDWISGGRAGNYWLFALMLLDPLFALAATERYVHWDE